MDSNYVAIIFVASFVSCASKVRYGNFGELKEPLKCMYPRHEVDFFVISCMYCVFLLTYVVHMNLYPV